MRGRPGVSQLLELRPAAREPPGCPVQAKIAHKLAPLTAYVMVGINGLFYSGPLSSGLFGREYFLPPSILEEILNFLPP